MRAFLRHLARGPGLLAPFLVGGSVLLLTSLAFFRVALLPEFGAELGMSAVQLGVVTTVFAVGRLAADLPGGHLADRVGALPLLGISALVASLGSVMLGLAPSVLPVYVASLVLGLSSSVTNATGMTYFSTVGGTAARGTSMAIFSAALLGGQALGPAVAGLSASAWGWRAALVGGGVAAGVLGVAVLARGRGATTPAAAALGKEVGRVEEGEGPAPVQLLTLQAVSFVMFFTLGSIPQTLVPVIGSHELGLSAGAIGLALGAGGGARFVGTLAGGRVSDRVSRKMAMVPALLAMAVGVAILAPWDHVVAWMGAILLMSLASFAVPVAATVLGDLSPAERVGSQLGRFRFAGDLGLVAGPVLVTSLYDGYGRAAAVLSVSGLLVLVALVSARLVPETNPRGREPRA